MHLYSKDMHMHNEADTVAEHEYLNNQEFFLHQNEHSLNRRVLCRNAHSLQILPKYHPNSR